MDAQQFLAEFGHIANAPGGVVQLRKLILRYAISGRLVENNENEDLEDYFQAIQEDMATKAISRNIKVRNYSGKHSFAFPLSIPKSWKLLNLSEFALINMGQSPKSESVSEISKTGLPFFQGKSEFGSLHPTPRKWCSEPKKIAVANDILLSVRAPVGPTNLAVENTCIGRGLTGITALGGTNCKYLLYVFRALEEIISAQGVGTTFIAISLKDVQAIPIPVPPLEEQSRIVAKVDELMALCDQLEAQQNKRRTLQNHLRQATLQAVAASQSSHELKESWQRLQANFGLLFSAPEDIAQIRHLILDLAASGYLSEHQEGDSDPQDSLANAAIYQSKEFSVRELREINALPEPTIENGRLQITLGRIIKLVSGQHLAPDKYNTSKNGIPYITGPAEFSDGRPSPSKWTLERRAVAESGDILITVKGSGVGKTAICDLEELAISRQLMAIRALVDTNKSYLAICVDSAERKFQEQKFGIAIPGIGRDEVLNLSVVLPSVEEQGRIVNRVSELMRFCDELALNLKSISTVGERLATASVSDLTGIAIEQEEEPMKAPQTELLAPVRLGTPPDVKAQAPLATILARHNGEMSAKDLWQSFGLDKTIDEFYAQLKTEVAHGWLLEPTPAEMREKQES